MSSRIPASIDLGSWMARRAELTPQRRALRFEGVTLTFSQLQERIDRFAAALRTGGVCHGDRVAFLGFNHPAFFYTMFAAARLGAIFVPLNFRLTGPELAYILGDSGVHTLVADDEHRELTTSIRGTVPVRRWITTGNPVEGWEHLAGLIDGSEALAQADPVSSDDVAVIMYTSGTTGRPKGAMLTHANLFWNNVNLLHASDVATGDISLVCAPLFHIGGLNVTTLGTWQKGGEVVLTRAFEPGEVLELIPRYGVTTMFGVPAMFLFMSHHHSFEQADLTSIRFFVCGGAPVPEPLIKLYNGRGIAFLQGYGLTETAPFALLLPAEKAAEKVGSAGIPPMFTEVCLMTADGAVVTEPAVRGEICVRGANVMKGYWNRPDATSEAIDERGWFHTGDVGYADEEGYVYVVDRVKDMVISGGENVYPAEVETVLYEHPAVAEVAVIGLPDERWGEAVVAVVAPKVGAAVSLEDLRRFAAERLARYKLPSRLEIVDALPRNPAGKVLKFELRRQFGEG